MVCDGYVVYPLSGSMFANSQLYSGLLCGSNMPRCQCCSISEVFTRAVRFPVQGNINSNTVDKAKADDGSSWLIYKIVDIIRYRAVQHRAVIATGIVTNIMIIISVLSAFPWVRKSVLLQSRCTTMTNDDAVLTTMSSRSTTVSLVGSALHSPGSSLSPEMPTTSRKVDGEPMATP